jgi:dipeptidyl aminopeptidase/acylaminoacyl peptidase
MSNGPTPATPWRARLWRATLLLAGVGLASAVWAQQDAVRFDPTTVKAAKDLPIEQWFRRGEFQNMSLSPNGTKLAAVSPFKGRGNLIVVDLEKRTRAVITSFETMDVADFIWINNKRLCLRVADGQEVTGRVNYRGQYCVDADGTGLRDVTQVKGRPANINFLRGVSDDSDEAYVVMNERSRDSVDAFIFNTRNGQYKLLSFDSPGRVQSWVLDRNGIPRAAVRQEADDNTSTVWVRDGEGAPWAKIHSYTWSEAELEPLAFDWDGNTMYVATNVPSNDRKAIYKYDVKARKLGELVHGHPMVDVDGGLLFDTVKKKLMGVRYQADKPQHVWFDEEMANLQAQIDATLKGQTNTLRPTSDRKKVLISSASDRNPGAYFLYDAEKKAIEALPETRPWIKPDLMAERKFITYKARDGRVIPAYVTLPPHKDAKNLPLIVHVHGGPVVRGYNWVSWGRWPDAQFLASRGYAVLEPEPRASDGYGLQHIRAGMRQWGLTMQDDINDGALHLVKEGIADKSRMCIYGGSYGGYATLMGIVRDPDLWKCGNATVAVSDLLELLTISYADYSERTNTAPESYWSRLVGDVSTPAGRQKLLDQSPFTHAAKAKAPLMLTMGSDDRRVPLIQGERMRDALLKAGKTVEWKVYTGEGHGFNKDENVFDFYRRTERFFAEHLKP